MIHLSRWGKARASDICPGKNYWVVVSEELERFRQSIPSELGVMIGVMALNHISGFENPAPPSPLSLIEFICLSFAYCDILRQFEAASEIITGKIYTYRLLLVEVLHCGLELGWWLPLTYSCVGPMKEAVLSCYGP